MAVTRSAVAAAMLAGWTVVALAATPPSPIGRWLTQDRGGVIEIAACGSALCGRIVGLTAKPDGSEPKDWQGRSDCGLTIIQNMAMTDAGHWRGNILNPEDGRMYDAELHVDDAGRLQLRGFLLIPLLGSTQVWTHYAGRVASDCRMT